jgi:serine/threonine protein kinase
MVDHGNKISLFRRLRDAQVECPLNDQRFLPLDVMNEVITEDTVRQAISGKLGRIFDRKLPSKIVKDAKKTFAILVEIGEPGKMKELFLEGLTDDHLPLSPIKDSNELQSENGKRFPSFARWETEQRVTDFIDKQWIFLAPVLDISGRFIKLSSKCPLPFLDMDEIGHTGTSTVYKTCLHHAHFTPQPPTPTRTPHHLRVATKEFRSAELFAQERENLNTVHSLAHTHLVTHFATYQKGTHYYVVFPWAQGGNLRDFWASQDTLPRDANLTLWALRQLHGLACALEALHSVNCRHGDLKPENILHFSSSASSTSTPTTPTTDAVDGKLVIADVGISRTHAHATQLRHKGTATRATTPAYEAPEARSNHAPRARRYDVWSLGCIFLEFALWVLHDDEAIASFESARNPDSLFYLLSSSNSNSNSTSTGSGGSRDVSASTEGRGLEIHPVVARAIAELRGDPRCSGDTVFGEFIEVIEKDLLQIEVEQRVFAEELAEKLQRIVQSAEAGSRPLFNDVSEVPEKLRFSRYAT